MAGQGGGGGKSKGWRGKKMGRQGQRVAGKEDGEARAKHNSQSSQQEGEATGTPEERGREWSCRQGGRVYGCEGSRGLATYLWKEKKRGEGGCMESGHGVAELGLGRSGRGKRHTCSHLGWLPEP